MDTSLANPEPGQVPPVKGPKSLSSYRKVELSKELVHELKLWKLKCLPSEENLVIVSDRGKPVRRQIVNNRLRQVLKALKIEKRLTPHSFRHTFASLLLAERRPVPEVSRLLGHKNAQITYSTYAHYVPSEDTKKAVQDLATSIFHRSTN